MLAPSMTCAGGYSPNQRKIAEELRRVVSTAHSHLSILEQDGFLRRGLGQPRTIAEPVATAAPPGVSQLYAPVTAEDTLANCCGNLLSTLGLEILFPQQAELMRQARASMRRPGPADFGLTSEAIAASRGKMATGGGAEPGGSVAQNAAGQGADAA
jgi:hypothetical protein